MNSNTADASRALFGMSREGLTLKQFDNLNKHSVPGRAMTLDLFINLALVFLVGNILGVLFASNVGYFVGIVFVLIGYVLLRRDRPDAERPIKLGPIWIPIAGGLAAFNLVLAVVGTLNPELTGYGGTKEILNRAGAGPRLAAPVRDPALRAGSGRPAGGAGRACSVGGGGLVALDVQAARASGSERGLDFRSC